MRQSEVAKYDFIEVMPANYLPLIVRGRSGHGRAQTIIKSLIEVEIASASPFLRQEMSTIWSRKMRFIGRSLSASLGQGL